MEFSCKFFHCLMMHNTPTKPLLCLSVIVIRLRNCPRGESRRDVRVLNMLRLVLHTEFSNARLESPLVYNNLIVPDISVTVFNTPEARARYSTDHGNEDESSTETASDDQGNDPARHTSATVEDSEEQPPAPRRERRKRKHSKAAGQRSESTSDNEQHPRPLKRKRKRNHSPPGHPRGREESTGRKRTCQGSSGNQRGNTTEHKDHTNTDARQETPSGLLNTRRKTYKRPAQHGSSQSVEPVPGPSGRNEPSLERNLKHIQVKVEAPSQDSNASAQEPLTGRGKRKRARKSNKSPARQPATSSTDSEEEPQPLRKRRKKQRWNTQKIIEIQNAHSWHKHPSPTILGQRLVTVHKKMLSIYLFLK